MKQYSLWGSLNLEQHCLVEISAMIDMPYVLLANTVTSSYFQHLKCGLSELGCVICVKHTRFQRVSMKKECKISQFWLHVEIMIVLIYWINILRLISPVSFLMWLTENLKLPMWLTYYFTALEHVRTWGALDKGSNPHSGDHLECLCLSQSRLHIRNNGEL